LGVGLDTPIGESLSIVALRGAFVDTLATPPHAEPRRRYLGFELEYSFLTVLFIGGGAQFPLGREAEGPRVQWQAGLRFPIRVLSLE
jgi:hypothetical protein